MEIIFILQLNLLVGIWYTYNLGILQFDENEYYLTNTNIGI